MRQAAGSSGSPVFTNRRCMLWPGMYWPNWGKDAGVSEEPERAESAGAVDWARARLGFDADAVQARVLGCASQRVILNCTRQWGKSTVTAAKAVHQAMTQPGSLTLV